jgi:hypothetical protein
MHTTAMISRIPEVTSRTLCMEKPFVCSINIVTIVLKYGCFPFDCGWRRRPGLGQVAQNRELGLTFFAILDNLGFPLIMACF